MISFKVGSETYWAAPLAQGHFRSACQEHQSHSIFTVLVQHSRFLLKLLQVFCIVYENLMEETMPGVIENHIKVSLKRFQISSKIMKM
jgi:hypothetical protein